MSFIDNLLKKGTQGIERAKFEAEKIQRTLRMESELNDLKKSLDGKRLEFGDRALELYRAGMIQSPTLGAILREIETFQQKVTLKEEELKIAQAEQFVDPAATGSPTPPPAQSVPVSVETPPPAPTYTPPPAPTYTPPPAPEAPATPAVSTRPCPSCGFMMPMTSVFCPSCGTRIGR
ncbi:MAG: zinc ribbon domain-containing protein [Roseiflexaceae bacterium]